MVLMSINGIESLKIAVQNVGYDKLTLKEGQFIVSIRICKSNSEDEFGWNELESTCNSVDGRETKNDNILNIEYHQLQTDEELEDIRKGLARVNPSSISLGFFNINLCQIDNSKELDFLNHVDKISLHKSSCIWQQKLPLVYIKDEKDLKNLISADINQFRKLNIEEFKNLQNADSKIKMIKDIICDKGFKNGLPKFVIKKGILCRRIISKKKGKIFLTVYMPSQILKDVLAYTHLYEQHPSKRQTFKVFSEDYYNPQAKKLSRTMCR